MSLVANIRRQGARWFLIFALWTVLGLSFASQFYLSSSRLGRQVSWWYAVHYALCDWYVFALLSIPVVWMSRRFHLDRSNWIKHLPLHLSASALFSLIYVMLRSFVEVVQNWIGGQNVGFGEVFHPLLIKSFHFNALIYWVILTAGHAMHYYRQARDRELRALELEKHLAQARLQALQMQLNPHFLFNTLHAISALMHKDVEAADSMIARLSDLLRYALESTDAQEVPLHQELSFLDKYLEIEQTRFGDRLMIHREIDPVSLEVWVPNLILQPILENAIRHGIEPHARRGEIWITTRVVGKEVELAVRDNGAGLAKGVSLDEGVGLSNTRARLKELYGTRSRFEIENGRTGGLTVRLIIPRRGAAQTERSAASIVELAVE